MKYNYREIHSAIVAWMEDENRILPAWVEDEKDLKIDRDLLNDKPLHVVKMKGRSMFYIYLDFAYYQSNYKDEGYLRLLPWIAHQILDLKNPRFAAITTHEQAVKAAIAGAGGEYRVPGTRIKAAMEGKLVAIFHGEYQVDMLDVEFAYDMMRLDQSIYAIQQEAMMTTCVDEHSGE